MSKHCKDRKSIPSGSTAEGWNEILKEMKTQLGTDFRKDFFFFFGKQQGQVGTLNLKCLGWYNRMKVMFSLSGFKWDEHKQIVAAESRV